MKQIKDINHIRLDNTVITLGKFDGCHIGHRKLFERAVQLKENGLSAVIFTFSIHPSKVLSAPADKTSDSMRLILTEEEQIEELYPEGIDYLVRFPFNKETKTMEPEKFVKEILVEKFGVKDIVCGTDFRFGKDRKGTPETLKQLGRSLGFDVHVVEKVTVKPEGFPDEVEVSSSLIKHEILKGHMENVQMMLGRPFFVRGIVRHGKHLGNTIGFPTINQTAPEDKILPPDGVYATRTRIGGELFDSITNVGVRPTFDDGVKRNVETNLFGFDRDVYGQTADVFFYRYIRPEKRFGNIMELKEEIESNKKEVTAFFRKIPKA